MKNIINFYYGINVFNIYKKNEKFIFKYNDNNYYFIPYDRDIQDINALISVCNVLKGRNILTNELVCNKYNNFITPSNGKFFVLMKENVKNYKICTNDIFYIQNNAAGINFNQSLLRNNYIELWKKKIDYYESKFKNISRKHRIIMKSFDYYVGLGENAIMYMVNNNISVNNIVLAHRRINEKMDSIDFYNPLNYIFDSRARDYAEYIKIMFFYENADEDSLLAILKYINFNREEYILFFSRMLYPTYYFDLLDKIMLFNEEEGVLVNVINKTDKYIGFLKRLIYYINYNSRMNIPVIDWIIKKYS